MNGRLSQRGTVQQENAVRDHRRMMYRPLDWLSGTNGNDLEFVEVYNSNPFVEDISGYRIAGAMDYTFPANTVLQGGEYRVIARNAGRVASEYCLSNVLGPFTGVLPQSGTVRLRNKEGAVLLEVEYSNEPPWPAGADGTGHSLVLSRPSYGENSPEAWGIVIRPAVLLARMILPAQPWNDLS